jgi:hypothetical protein
VDEIGVDGDLHIILGKGEILPEVLPFFVELDRLPELLDLL